MNEIAAQFFTVFVMSGFFGLIAWGAIKSFGEDSYFFVLLLAVVLFSMLAKEAPIPTYLATLGFMLFINFIDEKERRFSYRIYNAVVSSIVIFVLALLLAALFGGAGGGGDCTRSSPQFC